MPRHVPKLTRQSWQRNWRERHPLLAAWHQNLSRAKGRKIKVVWDIEEFAQWCCLTGYLVFRDGDVTIDREDATQGYSFGNCQLLSNFANGCKGEQERRSGSCYKRVSSGSGLRSAQRSGLQGE
jgi:hypothetical protein